MTGTSAVGISHRSLSPCGTRNRSAGELWQLPRAVHGFRIHQVRRQHFGVSMLAGVQVEHEVGQGAFQPRAQIPIHRKARAGQFHGAFQDRECPALAEFPMRLGSEIKLAAAYPSGALRRCRRRSVRPARSRAADSGCPSEFHAAAHRDSDCLLFRVPEIFSRSSLVSCISGAGVLTALLQLGDLFGSPVALGLACVSASGDRLPPARVDLRRNPSALQPDSCRAGAASPQPAAGCREQNSDQAWELIL